MMVMWGLSVGEEVNNVNYLSGRIHGVVAGDPKWDGRGPLDAHAHVKGKVWRRPGGSPNTIRLAFGSPDRSDMSVNHNALPQSTITWTWGDDGWEMIDVRWSK